jgi:hypothetical protein
MTTAYFFSNETKNEFVYVTDIGSYTLEFKTIAERILNMKNWDTTDKVVMMLMNSSSLTKYVYQNKKFTLTYDSEPKYDWIEIEVGEDEIETECESYYNEDYEYDDYDVEMYDDRYDERDDDDGGSYGYEDEFFESCDIY